MTQITLTGTSPTEYTAEIVKDDTTLTIVNATATVVPYVPPVVVPPPIVITPPAPTPTPPPTPTPVDPSAPVTVVSQTLVAENNSVKVGDTFTVSGTLTMSDGTTKPVTAYSTGYDKSLLSAPNGTTPRFTALAPGNAKIQNANSGVYGYVIVTILAADGSEPAPVPAPAPAPSNPPSAPTTGASMPTVPGITSDTVTLTAKLGDTIPFVVTASKGQRVPLVAGDPTKGSLMYYADGLCACIENMYAGLTGDISGTFTLKAGDTVLFDGPLTLYAAAGPRAFWLTMPAVKPYFDRSLFPNYGAGSESASMYAAYIAADNSPMSRGMSASTMGRTGEQETLGPLRQCDADYLTNPSAENAIVVRGTADSARTWGFHWIDFATGRMLDVSKYPKATALSVFQGITGNPIAKFTTSNPNVVDTSASHAPVFCALATQLFDTDYDREELALWANYCGGLWNNYSYRMPCGYTKAASGQTRGKGRGLVVALYAAKYSDNTAYFQNWLDNIAPDMESTWLGQSGIHVDQRDIPYPNSGIAPWQEHILGYALGLALQHGHTRFQAVFDYFAELVIESLLDSPHEFSTIYELAIKDASGNFAPDFKAALALQATYSPNLADAMKCAEGSPELIAALFPGTKGNGYQAGDFSGYPWAPDGYAAMMQPFVAMVADYATDQVRAQAAWAKFLQWRRIDSSKNPKYNVVPA